MTRLAGKVAVITGGASGIGAATATRFVNEGACVVLADVQDPAGSELARRLGAAARFHHVDVASEDDVAAVVDFAVAEFGRLDVMFNNAGIIGAVGSIARSRMSEVDRTFAVILRGAFLGAKHAARVMIPARSGVIISTTSPGGLHGGLGPHAYSAAKAGIVGLTQSVAAELRRHRIRVNAVAPGATVSAMTADLTTGDPGDLNGAAAAMSTDSDVAGRPGIPEDIAAAVAYLASDDAVFVTGSTLMVDGGATYASGPSPFATDQWDSSLAVLEGGRRA
jgi:NAD(P)-dependent dehydrogenase (short-subunit alcohol dehydrogenase family)